ncbi:MAG: Smr/MutS family protein, partial [Candidatus Kapaibacterium sp.]
TRRVLSCQGGARGRARRGGAGPGDGLPRMRPAVACGRGTRRCRQPRRREAAAPGIKEDAKEKASELTKLRTRQKEELKEIELEVAEHKTESAPKVEAGFELKAGAKVRLLSNPSQIGEVISIKGSEAEVAFGSMKMKAKLAQLEVISGAEARQDERKLKQFGTFFDEAFSPRIDLRGKYGDEGVVEVEKFIATANARGLNKVEILHGTGSGALGRRIHQSLKSNSDVASFRFGERTEGGMGVTIVELK